MTRAHFELQTLVTHHIKSHQSQGLELQLSAQY